MVLQKKSIVLYTQLVAACQFFSPTILVCGPRERFEALYPGRSAGQCLYNSTLANPT